MLSFVNYILFEPDKHLLQIRWGPKSASERDPRPIGLSFLYGPALS